ncbi:hypothetical protein [Nitrospina watsonii]|uniref:Uncharacterized protein n=1 Tax=Nitrospina watsonii TaxID=1323948 RepID=A0ABN8W5T7_9BACT|nr:hypothetical protein [Nitrospina watsonii]CAI2719006.1 conserved protein of unknown function [Nitrospina watsonii]
MADILQWFDSFLSELPPLLQLVFGILGGLGVFKLLTWVAGLFKKEEKNE